MKLDPGFITHWKTERLVDQLGPEAIVVILKIWSRAQIKREWKGLEITSKRLALETKWKGDADHLFRVLTDEDAPWLDLEEDGTYSIHDFEDHQRQVIHLWAAGAKGGRPRKEKSPAPPKEIDTSSSLSSSSSPRCFSNGSSNGNHMVSDLPFTSENFASAWKSWGDHRREKRAKLTPTSIKQQLKELGQMGETRAIATILHSIKNGWTGLFEPNVQNGHHPQFKGLQEDIPLP